MAVMFFSLTFVTNYGIKRDKYKFVFYKCLYQKIKFFLIHLQPSSSNKSRKLGHFWDTKSQQIRINRNTRLHKKNINLMILLLLFVFIHSD